MPPTDLVLFILELESKVNNDVEDMLDVEGERGDRPRGRPSGRVRCQDAPAIRRTRLNDIEGDEPTHPHMPRPRADIHPRGLEEKPLRKMAEAFKELANTLNSQTLDETVQMEVAPFSHACTLVSPLFRCLGIAFKFAELDYIAKVDDLAEASKSITTLHKMMEQDIQANCVRRAGGSGFGGGQDAGSEVAMVQACDEEVHGCSNTEVWRLAMDGFKRGRGRSKKYWREVIRHDMEHLQLIEDMTLDRKM
ncbi:Accelerated cell death 11 [Capsicum baccatum]|uniref:Accelerated cell death 11 n=1 Tax=Capsicum baccatum TaxID=33114 RepID=A0A2G2XDU5_CAPBA|nr:Accelerated cell death 11 [Capsicum baccatum]